MVHPGLVFGAGLFTRVEAAEESESFAGLLVMACSCAIELWSVVPGLEIAPIGIRETVSSVGFLHGPAAEGGRKALPWLVSARLLLLPAPVIVRLWYRLGAKGGTGVIDPPFQDPLAGDGWCSS